MVADIRWIAMFCVVVQLCHVEGRVIDSEDRDVFQGGNEDPYGEEPFEEDRYEESKAETQETPATGTNSQLQQPLPEGQRPYRECSDPGDCYPDECCHLGMQRYSEPSCRKLGAEGDFCRVGQEPVNRTLYYPNGEAKEVSNAHILFCPCSEGLTCLRALCRPSREQHLVDKSHENIL